jgi:hypothetical protein
MWHAWERTENCTRLWWKSLKERDHSEDQGVGYRKSDQSLTYYVESRLGGPQ